MDKKLAQLISDYQAAVGSAVSLMSESQIPVPSSRNDWVDADIPHRGELKNGIFYYKHGYGCTVQLPEGEVNFDFGPRGQIDGFDVWRLWQFCQSRPDIYKFDTEKALSDCVQCALAKGKLVDLSHGLFYVVDSFRSLGQEVSQILTKGCSLPHMTRDSVRILSAQCFDSANLMLQHYLSMDQVRKKKQKLGNADGLKFRVYLLSWLGYLHSTSEGFKNLSVRQLLMNKRPESFLELIPNCDDIGKLEKRHADDLRVLRNDIFHLRVDEDAIRLFFLDDGERLAWARELHAEFDGFFLSYRSLTEVHYILTGRLGESQIRRQSDERRKRKAERTLRKFP